MIEITFVYSDTISEHVAYKWKYVTKEYASGIVPTDTLRIFSSTDVPSNLYKDPTLYYYDRVTDTLMLVSDNPDLDPDPIPPEEDIRKVKWPNILDKPDQFKPEPHTHDASDVISGIVQNAEYAKLAGSIDWNDVTGKPEDQFGDKLDGHINNKENPHEVTPFQIGAVNRDEIDAIVKDTAYPDMTDKAGFLLTTNGTNVLWIKIPALDVFNDLSGKENWVLTIKDGELVFVPREEISDNIIPTGVVIKDDEDNFNFKIGTGPSRLVGIDESGDYVLGLETNLTTLTLNSKNEIILG